MSAARVAVVAHQRKSLGGGLDELRRRITDEGVGELLWYEVPKSRKAPKKARRAVRGGRRAGRRVGRRRHGAALRGRARRLRRAGRDRPGRHRQPARAQPRHPARTWPEAVRVAFHGARRALDLGRVNGEHFAVMAGVGFDADMIADADRGAKDRLGRLAYVRAGLRHVRGRAAPVRVEVDGNELVPRRRELRAARQRRQDHRRHPGLRRRPTRTTAGWRSAWPPPAARCSGRARSAGWRSAGRRSRRSCGSPGPARCDVTAGRSRRGTSSTAGPASRSPGSRPGWCRARSRSACRPATPDHAPREQRPAPPLGCPAWRHLRTSSAAYNRWLGLELVETTRRPGRRHRTTCGPTTSSRTGSCTAACTAR